MGLQPGRELSPWFYMEDTGNDDGVIERVQAKVEALNVEAACYSVNPVSRSGEMYEGIPITLSCKNIQTNIVV